jgi:hypothetical protein
MEKLGCSDAVVLALHESEKLEDDSGCEDQAVNTLSVHDIQ